MSAEAPRGELTPEIAPPAKEDSLSESGTSRRRFLRDAILFGVGTGLMAAGVIDLFRFQREIDEKAKVTYPKLKPSEDIQLARQAVTVFETGATELARRGQIAQIPQQFDQENIRQAYQTIEEDKQVENSRDGLRNKLFSEPLPVIGVSRPFVDLMIATSGVLPMMEGVILDPMRQGLHAVQKQVDRFGTFVRSRNT